jgi:hypothetical protein
MVERQLPKLHTRVRFPSPAPVFRLPHRQNLKKPLLESIKLSDFVQANRSSPLLWLRNPEEEFRMKPLPDHGLPLVQLKEQRRELVVALQNHVGSIEGWHLMQIAAVQQAINAFEDVIADLEAEDAENEMPTLTFVA